jgi:phosphoglycolate phosphatase-like HAD superfamily hydrolase
MPGNLAAVLFDVDGVLIDSLMKHLDFCRDEASTLSLQIAIPRPDEFRRMVLSGAKVSPMPDFFRALGFPENTINQAFNDYKQKFSTAYTPTVFDGVIATLETLHKAGVKLGLITSNVQANVDGVLGSRLLSLFDPLCRFYFKAGETKTSQILQGAKQLNVEIVECVFVGDQPADEIAARAAGSKFVGVTYGWGFSTGKEEAFEMANNVYEIPLAAQKAVLCAPQAIQFDYAWKWFNYHADQRIKMFNYMLVGLGLFATAIVGTLDKHLPIWVPIALCFLAGIIALIFSRIDVRNQYLLQLSEEVLTELERSQIFGRNNWILGRSGEKIRFGILWRQHLIDDKYSCFMKFIVGAWQGRHRIWLRTIAVILAFLFLASSFLILKYGLPNQGAKDTPKPSSFEGPE